jgi:hypothetical protein
VAASYNAVSLVVKLRRSSHSTKKNDRHKFRFKLADGPPYVPIRGRRAMKKLNGRHHFMSSPPRLRRQKYFQAKPELMKFPQFPDIISGTGEVD